jgi:2-polyprenyl-3-methyl-5-hydroxy-6-metoxy-1,4-benzoquinol methylase
VSSNPLYYQANRGVMTRFLPDEYGRVLEVGCGSGGFYDHLRQPCEVWGVEPNPEAAKAAALKMHRILVGRYDLVADQLPDGYFDMIVCNDVIEHMDDHDAFLEAIKRKIRPGGWIVGSIPNVRHITALYKLLITKDWKYSESGILDRTHLRFFTQKSLRRTLREHGYSIEKFGGVGSIIKSGISRKINKPSSMQNFGYQAISLAVVVLTLGYYWDTQYPQYAFRVRLG